MVRLVSVYFVGRGIAAVLSLVSLGVYTRLLEPQEYARYVLVISGVGFVSLLLFQWARAALLRFLPMRVYSPEKTLANLATSIFWLCTAASLVVLGVSLLVPTWRFLLVLGAALERATAGSARADGQGRMGGRDARRALVASA